MEKRKKKPKSPTMVQTTKDKSIAGEYTSKVFRLDSMSGMYFSEIQEPNMSKLRSVYKLQLYNV